MHEAFLPPIIREGVIRIDQLVTATTTYGKDKQYKASRSDTSLAETESVQEFSTHTHLRSGFR
jgi:hypothetical protein